MTGRDCRRGTTMAKATFAAGCFWGVEETFRKLPGVTAAAVEVEYDPAKITYEQLLDVFWNNHDPTQLNRQGPDVGKQYRSAVFYQTPEQKAAAEASKAALQASGRFRRPVVTEITAAEPFWRAEEYHQRYLQKRGKDSCHL